MITTRMVILLGTLALLAGLTAWATLGLLGALLAIVLALLTSTAAYWGRSRASLRRMGGRPILWYEAPELYALVGALARRAGLPAPMIYLMPGATANAMAVATAESSAIGVTEPLLRHLPPEEVAAVIGHEISHIRHGDSALAMVAAGLAGAAALLAEVGRWGVIAGWLIGLPVRLPDLLTALVIAAGLPVVALMLRMALSREQEFLADAGAAALVGSPDLMARALWRLDQINRGAWWQRLLGMTTYVKPTGWARLLSSHPPTSERIARLRASLRSSRGVSGRVAVSYLFPR